MAKATMTVVPFIGDSNLRSIQPDHIYTVSEVKKLSLAELTELALLIPDLLQPESWNFVYSFADGDIVTKAARPTTFVKPTDDVIRAIKQRVQGEGYQMFTTVRNHYLFLEWDKFVGCFTLNSFCFNIKLGRSCFHSSTELHWTPSTGFSQRTFCLEKLEDCMEEVSCSLPKHSSGFNLPVDSGDGLDDWSDKELLSVRPFRGSWDGSQWGEFQGHPEFKPISFQVCIAEVLSFINRFDVDRIEESFRSLIDLQLESFDEALSNEFITVAIILFGYAEHEEVIKNYFPFLLTYMNILNDIRNVWIASDLKSNVVHVIDGGWGHLTHSWTVSLFVGRNPAISRKNPGTYVASQRSNM